MSGVLGLFFIIIHYARYLCSIHFPVCVIFYKSLSIKKVSGQCHKRIGVKSVLTEWLTYHFHLSR